MLPFLSKISKTNPCPQNQDISYALCAGTSLRTHLISSCCRRCTHEGVVRLILFCNPCPDPEPASRTQETITPRSLARARTCRENPSARFPSSRQGPVQPTNRTAQGAGTRATAPKPLSSLSITWVKDFTSPETKQ